MPVPKLKNLAILILVLANLILAVLVIPNRKDNSQEEAELWDSLVTLCEQQGVQLAADAMPEAVSLYVLELKEDGDADLQAAKTLLGEQLMVEADSTRYLSRYTSSAGQCSISRNGNFQAQLTGQKYYADVLIGAQKTLKAMGFSRHDLVQEGDTVVATQSVLGMPVFSGGLVMTYTGNCLTGLDGTFFTGAATLARVSDKPCLTAADVLVRFLSQRYELGWLGNRITAMEQGYVRSEAATAAAVRLTPVWRLQTDTGIFQVNGQTGEISAVS